MHFDYVAAMLLYVTGLGIMLFHSNLIKKIFGMNIMETAVFLLFILGGYVRGGKPPIAVPGQLPAAPVNPLPQALILTGLVVSVSVTAYALALVRALYQAYGTLSAPEIARRKGEFS